MGLGMGSELGWAALPRAARHGGLLSEPQLLSPKRTAPANRAGRISLSQHDDDYQVGSMTLLSAGTHTACAEDNGLRRSSGDSSATAPRPDLGGSLPTGKHHDRNHIARIADVADAVLEHREETAADATSTRGQSSAPIRRAGRRRSAT